MHRRSRRIPAPYFPLSLGAKPGIFESVNATDPENCGSSSGGPLRSSDLLPLVYEELRSVAHGKMRQDAAQTLSATSLVHEAWLRLSKGETSGRWANKQHFFAAAAEAMRRILIEQARTRQRLKRGGEMDRTDLSLSRIAAPEDDERLLAVHEALDEFESVDPDLAGLVKLRYFAGLTWEEISASLGIPERTLRRRWTYARAWLRERISRG